MQFSGTVQASSYAGGFVAYNRGSLTIQYSLSSGKIVGYEAGGFVSEQVSYCYISNSNFTGIMNVSDYGGGLVSYTYSASSTYLYNN